MVKLGFIGGNNIINMINSFTNSLKGYGWRELLAFMAGLALVIASAPSLLSAATVGSNFSGPLTVENATTEVVSANAQNYENIEYSFDYNAEALDNGDIFSFGWREMGGADNELGTINGQNDPATTTATSSIDESGSESGNLPSGAQVSNLEFYFTNSGVADDDDVIITNLVLQGDEVVVAKAETTIVVSEDTASGENDAGGWLFNRDQGTQSEYEFNTDESVIGDGALYVLPIDGNFNGNADKFIGELFVLEEIANIDSFSYDFQIGSTTSVSDANEFYLNVYANYGESSDTNYYDCKYDVVPSSGSTSGFTTVTFDPTESYTVTTRGSSPYTCPSTPVDMDLQSDGSTIRMFAINVGDTSANDTGVNGYFDNVVYETNTAVTTYDFEYEEVEEEPSTPVEAYTNSFEEDTDDWANYGGAIERVTSGNNGVPSQCGEYHAVIDGSVFSRWGGYADEFPTEGYTTEIDVYLDTVEADGSDKRFDFSSAINGTDGNHRRDFAFNLATNPGQNGVWLVNASNNTPGNPGAESNSLEITSSGWYTLQTYFHDNGSAVLEVTMNVIERSTGATIFSEDLSDSTDVIGSTIGGNRYGWFTHQQFDLDELAIDNAALYLGAPVSRDCDDVEEEEESSSSSSGGTRTRGGSGGSSNNGAPTPQVLGVSTSAVGQCGMLLKTYMSAGMENNSWEVMKLQAFLVGQGYFSVKMTGVFDAETDAAVKLYQAAHSEEILQPWIDAGLVTELPPNGNVYSFTRWHINNTVCPGGEMRPVLN